MPTLRPILAALAWWAILQGTGSRVYAGVAEPPLYLVLLRQTAGTDGKLQDIQAIKVIDLLSGSNEAVAVELPQAFLDQAGKKAAAEPPKKPTDNLVSFLYVPDDGKRGANRISFGLLNGIIGAVIDFRLLEHDAAMSFFGTGFGHSAFFVSYYALTSLPRATGEQRTAIIEAEIQRDAANLQGARIVARKDLSTPSQSVVEVVCKSPANKALTLRCRYVCNDRQTVSFTAITPDDLSAEDVQSVDRLFDAFCFR